MSPEPIPDDLLTGAPGVLPAELAARTADRLAWRQTLDNLARQSLVRIGLVLHRPTQAIVRYLQGHRHAAHDYLERALDTNEKALGPDHPEVASTLNNLGQLLRVISAVVKAGQRHLCGPPQSG